MMIKLINKKKMFRKIKMIQLLITIAIISLLIKDRLFKIIGK